MTPMESWYFESLRRWCAKRKSPPTLRQLAELCQKSKTAVRNALLALEYKGYVYRLSTGLRSDRRFRPVEEAR